MSLRRKSWTIILLMWFSEIVLRTFAFANATSLLPFDLGHCKRWRRKRNGGKVAFSFSFSVFSFFFLFGQIRRLIRQGPSEKEWKEKVEKEEWKVPLDFLTDRCWAQVSFSQLMRRFSVIEVGRHVQMTVFLPELISGCCLVH